MRTPPRPRILVVDDVPLFREVEALYLSRVGSVHTASSASEARERLVRESFDVAVIDLNLPDEAGDALCRAIVSAGEHPPRVVLVTRGAAAEHARAVAAGAADVLAKPLSRSDLLGSVGRLLSGDPRGLPRATVREPAHLRSDGRTSTGTLQNLSRGGAFIAAGWVPREGAELVVEFALPGESRPISTPGRVVWRRLSADPAGFGLRFVALDGASQRSIARYVDEHAPPALSPVAS
jgi:uncharacterized protein (TIGR02266 family)